MVEQKPKCYKYEDRIEYKIGGPKGKLHREDGPAVEYNGGTKKWYKNGKWHRENGPAVEYNNGTKFWYINGKQHREDGPAVEWNDGDKEWWLNGKQHRENGPAVEYNDGTKLWCLNDYELNKKEIETFKYLQTVPKSECLLYINTIFKPIILNRIKNG